jgi:4'-phosphopantetheinyl transferase
MESGVRVGLPGGEVHVWIARIDDPVQAASNRKLLSGEETIRSNRFQFERDRNEYINARGSLRQVLGRYLGVEPTSLQFTYNAFGKPYFHSSMEQCGLMFNLSHSSGLALIAMTQGCEVGVDVEAIREECSFHREVASNFFSVEEVAELDELPPEQWSRGFYCCWTRKEAFLKACGCGFSMPSTGFGVTVRPTEAPILRRCDWEPPTEWHIEHLEPLPGYVGAVAFQAGREKPLANPARTGECYGSMNI